MDIPTMGIFVQQDLKGYVEDGRPLPQIDDIKCCETICCAQTASIRCKEGTHAVDQRRSSAVNRWAVLL